MFAARRISLDPKPRYDVRFHPSFVDELVDKPTTDRDIRIPYSPRGTRRDVVMSNPRSSDYRVSDLDAAINRVKGWYEPPTRHP